MHKNSCYQTMTAEPSKIALFVPTPTAGEIALMTTPPRAPFVSYGGRHVSMRLPVMHALRAQGL